MLSRVDQAHLNMQQARELRAAGITYREIARRLLLTSNQLRLIRKALSRSKAAQSRLHAADPHGTSHDLPIGRSILPSGLRERLREAGYRTLGDIAKSLEDPGFPGLETLPGIGPHRANMVRDLLAHFDLLAGPDDLRAKVEAIFPDL
jgi:hypothetical protein